MQKQPTKTPKNPRAQAAHIVSSVIPLGSSSAQSLSQALTTIDSDDPNSSLIKELCYGVLRNKNTLALLIGQQLKKPIRNKDQDVHSLLLVGAYQLLHTRVPDHAAISETVAATKQLKKDWAKGLVNAVLRNLQKADVNKVLTAIDDEAILFDHPQWLVDAIKASWPDQYANILTINNQVGPMTLRVNQERCSREEYTTLLNAAGIKASPGLYSEQALYLEKPCPVTSLPHFTDGWVSVQDEAAQLAAGLLEVEPNERVLDACAAPGGKTCHLVESCPDLEMLHALELESQRASLIHDNITRLHPDKANIIVSVSNALDIERWWDKKPFDKILLDVPCSATGVIRRHPDIKWLRRVSDIDALQAVQGKLLALTWDILKPGGVLLYCTCSTLKDENEAVVEAFLNLQNDASLYTIDADWGAALNCGRQCFPTANGPDGFYYARLKKLKQ